ncbi:MAG: glycine cleavage system protein GcvH [Myxococcales bacterium]|jgi:glycine cleavage system H protein|nr:glycine cleavage system protein GcvH [Myxococcales bacterium]
MSLPNDLKYSKDHEWLKLDGTSVTIGITAFAAQQLGDIVFVELPKVGSAFKAGDALGVVESTKTASDVFYPISGKVLAINEALLDAPELINQDPYGKGWFVQIECSNPAELDTLLDANAYAALT